MKGSRKSRSAIREKCNVTENAKQTGNANGKRGKRRLAAAGILLLLVSFVLSPFSKLILSLSVMSVYSGMHERQSIMEAKGIELSIPGGGATSEADWYPFVMTFNPSAESFCRFIGEANRKLTILYNFPAFDLRLGQGLQPLIRSNIALLQCVLRGVSGDRCRGRIGKGLHFPDRCRGHIGTRTAGRRCCRRGCFAMRV